MMAPSGLFFVRRLGAVLAALPLMAGSALAMDAVYVHPAGDADGAGTEVDPVADIETAMGLVNPGGVVTLSAGLYPVASTIVITTPVTILGPQANVDPRQFSDLGPGATPGSRTVDDSATEAILDGTGAGRIFEVFSSGVTINGLSFRNASSGPIIVNTPAARKGLPVTNSNVRVLYNIFHSGSGKAVRFEYVNGGEISYNYLNGFGGGGIRLETATSNIDVEYNEIANISGNRPGILVDDENPATGTDFNITITGNWLYSIDSDGIRVGAPLNADKGAGIDRDMNVLLADNVIGVNPVEDTKLILIPESEIGGAGIMFNADQSIIRDNYITGVSTSGLFPGGLVLPDFATGVTITRNTFERIIFPTLSIGGAITLGTSGFSSEEGLGVLVVDNTFIENAPAINIGAYYGPVTIFHNNFVNNTPAFAVYNETQVGITDNRFELTAPPVPVLFKGINGVTDPIPEPVHVQAYIEESLGGPGYQIAFLGNEVHSGTVFTDSSAPTMALKGIDEPVIMVQRNWYAMAFDPDFDGNGIIDGLEVPQSLPTSAVPTTETLVVAQLDRDADGRTDAAELAGFYGTAFDVFDSDDDGIPDGALPDFGRPTTPTLLILKSTPGLPPIEDFVIDADTDGDTFPDWYEVARFTDPSDPDDFPPLGDIAANDSVDLADAVLALQLLNGSEPLTLATSDNITALSVAPDGLLSLNNPLQILRYSALIRAGLPALPGID